MRAPLACSGIVLGFGLFFSIVTTVLIKVRARARPQTNSVRSVAPAFG